VDEPENNFSDSSRFERLHQYACNPENFWPQVRERMKNLPSAFKTKQKAGEIFWLDSISFISDLPGKNDGTNGLGGGGVCTDTLIKLIRQAKKSLDIQSPYLITTALGQNLFREAVKRGVKVRILTNSLASTDNLEAFSGYQRDRKKLLSTGVKIFEFRPDAADRFKIMAGGLQEKLNYAPIFGLHAKSMVIDGRITVIGTFNLDPRSANLNTECVTVIYSENLARNVLKGFETDFSPENSWETTSESNPDSKASINKRVKTWTRRVVPKGIL
jgi:phosphatidylserine/phosphatidylglycerophosphate/cardiolipin synthase-like enzyme